MSKPGATVFVSRIEMQAELDRLRAENERLQALANVKGAMGMILQEQHANVLLRAQNVELREALTLSTDWIEIAGANEEHEAVHARVLSNRAILAKHKEQP